jgi:hypothetical protein
MFVCSMYFNYNNNDNPFLNVVQNSFIYRYIILQNIIGDARAKLNSNTFIPTWYFGTLHFELRITTYKLFFCLYLQKYKVYK